MAIYHNPDLSVVNALANGGEWDMTTLMRYAALTLRRPGIDAMDITRDELKDRMILISDFMEAGKGDLELVHAFLGLLEKD
jgi:hypothetical protein